MAFNKKVKQWTILRWLIASAWCLVSLRVAIPDYPYGVSYWDFLIKDVGGLQHELAYIAAIFICLITLTYFWQQQSERKETLRAIIKRIEKGV